MPAAQEIAALPKQGPNTLLTGTVRIDRASYSRLDPVLDPMFDQTPDRARLYALQLTAT